MYNMYYKNIIYSVQNVIKITQFPLYKLINDDTNKCNLIPQSKLTKQLQNHYSVKLNKYYNNILNYSNVLKYQLNFFKFNCNYFSKYNLKISI